MGFGITEFLLPGKTIMKDKRIYGDLSVVHQMFGLAAILLISFASSAQAQSQPPFMVGAASETITPCTGRFRALNICQEGYINVDAFDVNLSGGGTGIALGFNSSISVRALAIEDSATGHRIVLTSIDVVGLTSDFAATVRNQLANSRGLKPEEVLINVTHTHSAPVIREFCPGPRCEVERADSQYISGLTAKVITAIEGAIINMQPAFLYFGTGSSSIGKYRRSDEFLGPPPSLGVAYPQRLDVLEARDTAGNVLAIAFFFGCHPIHMMHTRLVSSDYVGITRDHVESQLRDLGSPAPQAMFFQSFGGDVNPLTFEAESDPNIADQKKTATGQQLANDIMQARGSITPLNGPIQATSQRLYISLDLNTTWANDGNSVLPTEVQRVTIGNDSNSWDLVASSHEVISEYAPYIRSYFPNPARVTVAGYSNLVESYLPTERVINIDFRQGDYEGLDSFRIYGKAKPNWSNSDFLNLSSGGSGNRYSLSLNGANQYFEVPNSPSLDITGRVTLEAWIKTNSPNSQQGIVERYNSFSGGVSDGGYGLRLSGGKLLFFTCRNGLNDFDLVFGNSNVSPNEWHHVAGVFDGTNLRVYLDGAIDGSKGSTFAPVSGTNSLKIGARGDDGTNTFNGLINEVRVTAEAIYENNFSPQLRLTSTSNTRGLWKFVSQNPYDSSVNNNVGGLINNAAFSADVPHDSGSAGNYSLQLGSPTAYLDVPNSASLNITGQITLEAWIKTNSSNDQQGIIERYKSFGQNTANGGYGLRISGGKLLFFTCNNGHDCDFISGASTITAGVWHHVAAVFDNTQLRVYVDGNIDGSKQSAFAPGTGTGSLKIGARGDDCLYKFNGLIDEARLTAAPVYTTSFIPERHLAPIIGTRGLWKFDGQVTKDSSVEQNDGMLTGGANYSADVP